MLKIQTIKKVSITQAASLTCLIHCILTPLIIVLSPVIGQFFNNPIIEFSLLSISIICGLTIVYQGYCKHKKKHALYLFSLGIGLWATHLISHQLKIIYIESLLLAIGTICVIASYYINHKLIICCPKQTSCCNK